MANPLQLGLETLGSLQNARTKQIAQEGAIQDQAYTQGQRDIEAEYNNLAQDYTQTKNPNSLRQMIAINPTMSGQIREQLGITDNATRSKALSQAQGFAQMIKANPEQAKAFFQQNLAQEPAFAGLADNLAADDFEGALNEIGYGVTALGGVPAYEAIFGKAQPDTKFIQELEASGIKRGTEEFKAAVLERYGKGDTIGYDVIEAVNPETGKAEFYQVSRVNPDEKIPLGIEVPRTASQIKEDAKTQAADDREKSTIESTLATVEKILGSEGLGGFSGLDFWKTWIPGTEWANVDAWMDQLQSQNFLTSVSQMKGMGALSENEGRKLSGAVAALNPRMTDEAIKKELETIQENLMIAKDRIDSGNLLSEEDRMDIDKDQSKKAPPAALEFLKANPDKANDFKAKYGYLPEGG